jgi:hypothetical protein
MLVSPTAVQRLKERVDDYKNKKDYCVLSNSFATLAISRHQKKSERGI